MSRLLWLKETETVFESLDERASPRFERAVKRAQTAAKQDPAFFTPKAKIEEETPAEKTVEPEQPIVKEKVRKRRTLAQKLDTLRQRMPDKVAEIQPKFLEPSIEDLLRMP